MKAKSSYREENRLEIEVQDTITIIDGDASKYWWKGQNQRTLKCGYFPRAILNPQRKLDSQDISLPLQNSFIHTGHMSAGEKDKTWGNPGKIDPIFLMNPMNPPDLIVDLTEEEENFRPNETNPEPAVQIVNSIQANKHTDDLIDLDFQISYPDYNDSLDSFYEPNIQPRTQTNAFNSTSANLAANTNSIPQSNSIYVNEQFNGSSYHYNSNTNANRIYYNDDINNHNKSSYQSQQYSTSNLATPQPINTAKPVVPPPPNSFLINQTHKFLNNQTQHLYQYRDSSQQNIILQSKKFDSNAYRLTNGGVTSKQNETTNAGKKLSVDDYLNKVISDVLKDDFKSLQINK